MSVSNPTILVIDSDIHTKPSIIGTKNTKGCFYAFLEGSNCRGGDTVQITGVPTPGPWITLVSAPESPLPMRCIDMTSGNNAPPPDQGRDYIFPILEYYEGALGSLIHQRVHSLGFESIVYLIMVLILDGN